MLNLKDEIMEFNKKYPNYHEFIINKKGNIIEIEESHTNTLFGIFKEKAPQDYEVLHDQIDTYGIAAVFHEILHATGYVTVHGKMPGSNNLFICGKPNKKQRRFLDVYMKEYRFAKLIEESDKFKKIL